MITSFLDKDDLNTHKPLWCRPIFRLYICHCRKL